MSRPPAMGKVNPCALVFVGDQPKVEAAEIVAAEITPVEKRQN